MQWLRMQWLRFPALSGRRAAGWAWLPARRAPRRRYLASPVSPVPQAPQRVPVPGPPRPGDV